jgi:uncharacterized protein (TIGR02246 family)
MDAKAREDAIPKKSANSISAKEQNVAESMLSRFVHSWNNADGSAYGEGYWPDAELVDPTGKIWNGRDAIAQMHIDLWNGPFLQSRVRGFIRNIRRLGSSSMIVDVDLALSGVKEVPPGAAKDSEDVVHAHLKHIMEKRQSVWRIVSAQNTFFLPDLG